MYIDNKMEQTNKKYGIDYSTRRAETDYQLFSFNSLWKPNTKTSYFVKCPRCFAKGITNVFDRRKGVCGICYDIKSDIEKIENFKNMKLNEDQN